MSAFFEKKFTSRIVGTDPISVSKSGSVYTIGAYISGFVDLSKFGAVGDANADDTAAVQAAVDYAESNNLAITGKGFFKIGAINYSTPQTKIVWRMSGAFILKDGESFTLQGDLTGIGPKTDPYAGPFLTANADMFTIYPSQTSQAGVIFGTEGGNVARNVSVMNNTQIGFLVDQSPTNQLFNCSCWPDETSASAIPLVIDESFWLDVVDCSFMAQTASGPRRSIVIRTTHGSSYYSGIINIKNTRLGNGGNILVQATSQRIGSIFIEDVSSEFMEAGRSLVDSDGSAERIKIIRPQAYDQDGGVYVINTTSANSQTVLTVDDAYGFVQDIAPGSYYPTLLTTGPNSVSDAPSPSLSPVIGTPYPISNDYTSWTASGVVTPGVLGPDGTDNAYITTDQVFWIYADTAYSLDVGDWVVCGVYVKDIDPAYGPMLQVYYDTGLGLIELTGDAGTDYGKVCRLATIDTSSRAVSSITPSVNVTDGGWHWVAGAFKVLSNNVPFGNYQVYFNMGADGKFFAPCLQKIPSSAGISDSDVRRHLKQLGPWSATANRGEVGALHYQTLYSGSVRSEGIPLSSVPAASASNAGQRWFVTDLSGATYTYGDVAADGGSRGGFVFSDGSDLREG